MVLEGGDGIVFAPVANVGQSGISQKNFISQISSKYVSTYPTQPHRPMHRTYAMQQAVGDTLAERQLVLRRHF
jgi:hypothetical protein